MLTVSSIIFIDDTSRLIFSPVFPIIFEIPFPGTAIVNSSLDGTTFMSYSIPSMFAGIFSIVLETESCPAGTVIICSLIKAPFFEVTPKS